MRKVARSSLKAFQCCIGKSLILSASNSTSLRKGNYPAPLINKNKTMKNLFAVKYYSTLLADNTTATLDPTLFENWTKEEVCSLLCTSKENGGAGLTMEDVKPLYDAGFKGTSLGNIVTCIQKKDEFFAFRDTRDSFPTIAPDTLKSVVFWVDTLIKTRLYHSTTIITPKHYHSTTMVTPEYIKEARNDPLFDYLRNTNPSKFLEELEKKIGQNIPLPKLGEIIHHCGSWVSKFNSGAKANANDYLRSLVFFWNSDILSEHDIKELKSSVNVVSYLSGDVLREKPAFYLFDEHNELFRKNSEGKIAATTDYFMDFTRWTRIGSGKTMTIYCGSAHSSFENYLPGGADSKIIRIVPPTETEFEKLIEDFKLDPKDNRIKFVTGRILKELKLLAKFLENQMITDEIFTTFMNNTEIKYQRRLDLLDRELEKIKKKNEFIKTLEELFALGLHTGRPHSIHGIAYDKGLMYRDKLGKLHIINEPAKRVLFDYYLKNNKIPSVPQNIYATLFQRYMIAQEYNIGQHYDRFNVVSAIPNYTTTLEYKIDVHQSLDLKDLSPLYRNKYLQNKVVLFVPESEKFPSFDYAIVSYKENDISIFLKQTTISTIDSHYKKTNATTDIDNLMKRVYIVENNTAIRKNCPDNYPKENLFSLLELIVYGVIGNFGDDETVITTNQKSGTTKELIKRRKYDVNSMVLQQGQFKPIITIDGLEINWYYIYESGSPLADQSVAEVKETGILYRSREDIVDRMKVFLKYSK